MAKHLVDIDDDALRAARVQLGTETIKDTVNQALRRAGQARSKTVTAALDRLARAGISDLEIGYSARSAAESCLASSSRRPRR
jgi:Arc/MetJ family transcription regulator